jgi:hypothetical protein
VVRRRAGGGDAITPNISGRSDSDKRAPGAPHTRRTVWPHVVSQSRLPLRQRSTPRR